MRTWNGFHWLTLEGHCEGPYEPGTRPTVAVKGRTFVYQLRYCLRFEVFTAVTMKNAVFWDIKPSSYFTGNTLRLRYRAQPVNAI
jgi:hypothetical protein